MDNNPEKLLVVDGSFQSNDLLSHWLSQEGFSAIYTSESGLNAIAKFDIFSPDIVITNVDLPDISGFDLCKRLKRVDKFVLVMCISYLENETSRLRAMEVGADDYLETNDHYQFMSKVRNLQRLKQLSNQLRDRYAELEDKNRLMEQHLQIGRRVQRALIPDIDTWMEQCHMVSFHQSMMDVGGDFFNVLQLKNQCFGIVMGDVSGHGIAASFLTVTMNVIIKNLTFWHFMPKDLMFQLNNEMLNLFRDDPALYACVLYAVVDPKAQIIYFSNAGLTLPLMVDGHTGEVTEMECAGLPVGLMRNADYEQCEVSYQQGDTMLLYTDGLQDLLYKDQPEEFLHAIKDLLSELHTTLDMRSILAQLHQHFTMTDKTDSTNIIDDTSMLLCRL